MIEFAKHYTIRTGNKDEDILTIPKEFLINNGKNKKDHVWLYSDKKERMIVSFEKLTGLHRLSKRSKKIRCTNSPSIGVPLVFLERNGLQSGDKVKMTMDGTKLIIEPYEKKD